MMINLILLAMDLVKETFKEVISDTDSKFSLEDINKLYILFEKAYYEGLDITEDMKDTIEKIQTNHDNI